MRRLRMLGACLIAVVAVAAVAAGPALAKKETRAEWKPLAHCPVNAPEEPAPWGSLSICAWAQSEGSSEFHAGNVTVHLAKPITLQGGLYENEETGVFRFAAPEDGAPVLKPVAQPGPTLTRDVEPALLPPAEKSRYESAVNRGQFKVTATIELAGPADTVFLNEGNLLNEEGTALALPVKVKLTNAFFGKSCYVGSDASPILIELTTGTSGSLTGEVGDLLTNQEGTLATIYGDSLVNNTYPAPGVEGCGKEVGAADAAMNAKLALPSTAPGSNTAIINGSLKQSSANEAREQIEKFGL